MSSSLSAAGPKHPSRPSRSPAEEAELRARLKGVHVDSRRALRKRIANVISVGLPLIGTIYAGWYFWHTPPGWIELSAFLLFYAFAGIGVGLGFHRCFTHQSFVPARPLKWLLLLAGSMAFQGSVIRWIADHRRHHRFTDKAWDTHSPFMDEDRPIRSRLRGLWHAHTGWLFDRTTTDYQVYAPDLLADRDMVFFHRMYFPIMAFSLAAPWAYGYLLGGPIAAWGAMLAGGCVRTTCFHHITWGVNSIGHAFGRQDATQRDGSRNNFWLAVVTFGEGWHNNHHAIPRSAYNRWKWYQIDMNGIIIAVLGRLGLLTDVVSAERIHAHQRQQDAIPLAQLEAAARRAVSEAQAATPEGDETAPAVAPSMTTRAVPAPALSRNRRRRRNSPGNAPGRRSRGTSGRRRTK